MLATGLDRVYIFLTSLFVLSLAFFLSIFYTLPSNVISMRSSQDAVRRDFNIIAPQSWAFFTKDPQSAEIDAYRSHGPVYKLAMTTPQGRMQNMFGLSRTQRAQGPEIGYLNSMHLPWKSCDNWTSECLKIAASFPAHWVTNDSPIPTLCGNIILTRANLVAWSYRNLTHETRRATSVVKLKVRCTHA